MTISGPIQIFALVGLLAVAGLGVALLNLGRANSSALDGGDDAAAATHAAATTAPAVTASTPAATTPAAPATTPAAPVKPKPASRT